MEIFKNKFLVKLIATICLFLTLLNFGGTNKVYAGEDDEVWGGVLITPIVKLLTAIADTVMELLHYSIQEQNAAIIKVSGSAEWWEKAAKWIAVIVGIIAVVGFVLLLGAIGGAAAWAAVAIKAGTAAATFSLSITGGTVVAGAVAGTLAGVAIHEGMIKDEIYLPAFSITAEEIFSNKLQLFDVNFFNPMSDQVITYNEIAESADMDAVNATVDNFETLLEDDITWILQREGDQDYTDNQIKMDKMKEAFGIETVYLCRMYVYSNSYEDSPTVSQRMERDDNREKYQHLATSTDWKNMYIWLDAETNKIYKLESVLIDGINNNEINLYVAQLADSTVEDVVAEGTLKTKTVTSTAKQLQGIISTWYFILRNIALLVLMLLLIYSGIRIVLGSTAGEKAKYKERIMDWLVAVCLIFVMHYIMVFAVEIVEKITKLIGNTVNGNVAYIVLTDEQKINAEKVLSDFNTVPDGEEDEYGDGNKTDAILENFPEDGKYALVWPTDLAGTFRIRSQLAAEGTSGWVGFSFCYLVLVLFTFFFAFTYAKRVLYMAFLTIIAPLVAMTYPIDKLTDGKAQAFDAWLKEYIFNLMIQPLHLLLYSILVTSAYVLATESPVYALVAVGFMMPAEKLMRRFFGFEKAKTPGLLGGAAGAAIAMSGLQSILKGSKGGGNSGHGNNSGKNNEQNKVKMARASNIDALDTIAGNTPRQPGGGSTTVRQPGGGGNAPQGGGAGPQSGGGGQPGSGGQRLVIGETGDTGRGSQRNTSIPQDNTSRPYDPRLTQDQIDEMRAEGIGPGDAEYDNWCRQFGVDEPYDPRLTQDQIDEMRAEGIEPGDAEYDNWCRQFGVDPSTEPGSVPQTNDQPAIDQPAADQPAADQPGTDLPDDDQPQLPVNNDANNNPVNVTHDESGRKPKRHLGRAIGTAALGVGKQAAVGILTGVHPLKAAGRIAAGAAVGAAGLAIGVASGDPNKAFQYTTAGAMAGSAFMKSMSNTKLIDGDEMKDDVKQAFYGDDYENTMLEKEKERFKKDKQNLEYLRKTLKLKDTKEAKEVMRTTGEECYKNGITDIEDIATIHELTKEGAKDRMDFKYAVAARNYAKKRLPTDTKSMSKDKIEKYQKTWQQEFEDKGYQNADQLAKNAWNAAVRFNKAKSGLKDL